MFTTYSNINQNEELIIRKYINSSLFNVEAIISYLNDNEEINSEIFTKFLTDKGKQNIRITYLKYFKNINRDIFIRRIPIYFYDVKDNNNSYDELGDMFDSFARYKKINSRSLNQELNEDFVDYADFDDLFKDIDFEPLYKILEDIYYSEDIPFNKLIEYFVNQCGNFSNFDIFYKWYNYTKLLDDVNEQNVFPNNILYAYNVELVKKNYKPIIYEVKDFYVKTSTNGEKKLLLRGEFPFDENNNIALKWIGLWCENIGDIILREVNINNRVPDFIRNKMKASLSRNISIELRSDSRVFIAKEIEDDDGFNTIWEQIYCGPEKMEFDYTAIIKKREFMNLSQKEVADHMCINLRTYQRIESGESSPDGLNLLKIMNYFDIKSYDELIKKVRIEDINYKKFLSGEGISKYIDK